MGAPSQQPGLFERPRLGRVKARKLTAPALQRVLNLLRDGQSHSTRDIMRACDVCAVNTVVTELRAHGCEIDCFPVTHEGRRHFRYQLRAEPRVPQASGSAGRAGASR